LVKVSRLLSFSPLIAQRTDDVPLMIIHCYYVFLSHTVLIFFFNDTATTEIYTLSLHDALPI